MSFTIAAAGKGGTGKTSVGRIFASGLNCGTSDDGDACGSCVNCISVQEGTSSSVIEIDAASHGLVDDIRNLRELLTYQMVAGWTVVLLDEAQSMSQEAYNALLKILEEPPPQTCFVLLTTEPHRISETVKSRCMSFSFRRIPDPLLTDRLGWVAEQQGINVQVEVLQEIARLADGGLRDALMLLDQANRVGCLAIEEFQEMFGIAEIGQFGIEKSLGRPRIGHAPAKQQLRHHGRNAGRTLQGRYPIGIMRVDPPAFGHEKPPSVVGQVYNLSTESLKRFSPS